MQTIQTYCSWVLNSRGAVVEAVVIAVNSLNNFKPVPFAFSAFILDGPALKLEELPCFSFNQWCEETDPVHERDLQLQYIAGVKDLPTSGILWKQFLDKVFEGLEDHAKHCNGGPGDSFDFTKTDCQMVQNYEQVKLIFQKKLMDIASRHGLLLCQRFLDFGAVEESQPQEGEWFFDVPEYGLDEDNIWTFYDTIFANCDYIYPREDKVAKRARYIKFMRMFVAKKGSEKGSEWLSCSDTLQHAPAHNADLGLYHCAFYKCLTTLFRHRKAENSTKYAIMELTDMHRGYCSMK